MNFMLLPLIAGNQSGLSPGLQVNVDLEPPSVENIVITLDPDSDTGILNDNAGFNTTPSFTVSDPFQVCLYRFFSFILCTQARQPRPFKWAQWSSKRYASLVVDNALSESLIG